MATKTLIEAISETAADWVLRQHNEVQRPMSTSQKRNNAMLGLALCRLAIDGIENEKERDIAFSSGAGVLSAAASLEYLGACVDLLEIPEVIDHPKWKWLINRILLKFDSTACAALLESMKIKLPREDDLRDMIVIGTFSEDSGVPIDDTCRVTVAKMILGGQACFSDPKHLRSAMIAAKDWMERHSP